MRRWSDLLRIIQEDEDGVRTYALALVVSGLNRSQQAVVASCWSARGLGGCPAQSCLAQTQWMFHLALDLKGGMLSDWGGSPKMGCQNHVTGGTRGI